MSKSRRVAEERLRSERVERRIRDAAAAHGLRVLREVGEGGSSRVSLVARRSGRLDGEEWADRFALKVPTIEARAPGSVPDSSSIQEERILRAVRSPHIVTLIDTVDPPPSRAVDAGGGPGGPALLLEWLAGGSLAELLARRVFLRRGEAVTVLVSVIRGLADLAAAGFEHGSLSASKVMFARDGRPVLVGLSHARPSLAASVATGERQSSSDTPGFREITALLAEAVAREHGRPDAEGFRQLSDVALPLGSADAAWLELEERVFALGQAEPVLLAESGLAPSNALAARLPGSDGAGIVRIDRQPSVIESLLHVDLAGVRDSARKVLDVLGPRRRLVWFACTSALMVVAALAALPPTPSSSRADTTSGTADMTSDKVETTSGATGTERRSKGGESAASGASSRGGHEGANAASRGGGEAVVGPADDEPVSAAVRLLRQRADCLGLDTGDSCLDTIDEPGSMLADVDRREFGERTRIDEAARLCDLEVSLLERVGDAALLALTPPEGRQDALGGDRDEQTRPASLLAIRGEAGWRLRELFAN